MIIGGARGNQLSPQELGKLHDPIGFAKTFGLKKPQVYCANEDCAYKAGSACPAGAVKKQCPNKSSLDYATGCPHFTGKEFQYDFLKQSMSGKYKIIADVTGRGTGKSAVKATQKVLMEATTEPYVRGMLFRTDRPIPAKIIVVGNTKDTSLLLRQHIHNAFESDEMLYSFIKDDTKTYMSTHSGAEIYFKTAGVDGRGIRGFHAEIIQNLRQQDVKCTIIIIFDEAWFTRATSCIAEVMEPSLQVGNVFSQIMLTTTPYDNHGEVHEITQSESPIVKNFNFAAYHNRFTSLEIIERFRDKCVKSDQGSIYNREVLGLSESDEGLYFPFKVWINSIDDDLEWLTYDEIEAGTTRIPGQYYCGVDPNKFRQLVHGDFASYLLVWVSSDRSVVRPVSLAKYKLDLKGDFKQRLKKINEIYNPQFMCDANSGFSLALSALGLQVRNAANNRLLLNPAMRLCKEDMVDGIFKMPASDIWEEERKCFVSKEDGVMNMPKLDHKGAWGQGYSNDLMRCLGYVYQGIMQDFGIEGTTEVFAGNISGETITKRRSNVVSIDAMRSRTNNRIARIKR